MTESKRVCLSAKVEIVDKTDEISILGVSRSNLGLSICRKLGAGECTVDTDHIPTNRISCCSTDSERPHRFCHLTYMYMYVASTVFGQVELKSQQGRRAKTGYT